MKRCNGSHILKTETFLFATGRVGTRSTLPKIKMTLQSPAMTSESFEPDRPTQRISGHGPGRLRNDDSSIRVGPSPARTILPARTRIGWPTCCQHREHDADFIALHNSFAPIILNKYDFNKSSKRLDAYLSMFAQARFAGEDTREVMAKFSQAGPRGNPDIAITEHFPLFGAGGSEQQMRNILDQSRTLASALYTASLFHVYMRQKVWMANYNIITSKWFGALITDTDDGLVAYADLSRIRSVSKPLRKHTCGVSGLRAFLFHETRGGG